VTAPWTLRPSPRRRVAPLWGALQPLARSTGTLALDITASQPRHHRVSTSTSPITQRP